MKKMIALFGALCAAAVGASPLVFTENFDEGASGWKLDGRRGEWRTGAGVNGTGALMIEGSEDGRGSDRWSSRPFACSPGGIYGIRFKVRSENASGGTVTTGPEFCNVDIGVPGKEWMRYQYCFAVPTNRSEIVIRFGQWECSGSFFFDDIELFEVEPVFCREDGVILGEGESARANSYYFNGGFGGEQRNHSRALNGFNAGFNSQRWCLGAGSFVAYKHQLPGRRFTRVSLAVDCGYYQKGKARVTVSSDGREWLPLAEITSTGTANLVVPENLLPADALFVRIDGDAAGCNLQIYDYRFDAEFSGPPLNVTGFTRFVEKVRAPEEIGVAVGSVGFDAESQRGSVELEIHNSTAKRFNAKFAVRSFNERRDKERSFSENTEVQAGGSGRVTIPFELNATGTWRMEVSAGDDYMVRFELFVPEFFDCDYGARLPCRSRDLDLWQASSGWKIPRGRRLPQEKCDELEIALAANESESIQLVLRPRRDLKDVFVSTTAFKDGRKMLPAGAVSVEKVGYVPVTRPTDGTGVAADWPDPILPQDAPCALPGGFNQPYWIRVNLPKGVEAGEYEGDIIIKADGVEERVELEIEVYGFELPDRMTCETAFGMDFGRLARYHRLKSDAERRDVLDKYLKCLADNHISPYDPAPLDHWKESFRGLPPWRGGRRVRGDAAAGEWSYRVDDTAEHGNISAHYGEDIKLTGKPLKVGFSHRGDKNQRALFTLNQQRADGSWISGHNRDMWVESSPQWKREEFIFKNFHPEAATLRITLWGAGYYEGKPSLGTTWFDDIVITEAESGKALFSDGDFESEVNSGRLAVDFDFSAWDRQMERAFSEYHFNTFRCPVKGLGGGTFMDRYEPQLEGLPEDQEAYGMLLEKYLKGIEQHLSEKGWLDEAYIYWFDEPDPKDYEFVMNGFAKLKRYAPGLRRMLTEQVEPELIGGPNLWCPLTPHLNVEGTEECRRAGDQFWWYVCCSPKAPYATLFIDHPGVELRLWLWQSWAERVTGILIWETVYWHSDCAYPDTLQNPYEDPMAWVSGYGVARGSRQPWGNGDGRFMYPPLAVFTADGPVTEGPNPTLRLEMLRDGLEDYEYFVILRKLLEDKGGKIGSRIKGQYENLLAVPESVSRSLTDFTTDPEAIEAHREKIARAIEELSR